jgi:hypothetical protein
MKQYEGESVNRSQMEVIHFLCASLSSSTAQLHDGLRRRRPCAYSEAGLSSQNWDRAWGVYYGRAAFCAVFLWAKNSMQTVFIKKYFLFTVGSVWSIKRFTTGLRNSLKDVRNSQVMKRSCGSGWDNKSLLSCRFRRTGNAMGQVYHCWWRMHREINVFTALDIIYFTSYVHWWHIYWLSLIVLYVIVSISGLGSKIFWCKQ